MNAKILTDNQLMNLALNHGLDKDIHADVMEELMSRIPDFKASSTFINLKETQQECFNRQLPLSHKLFLVGLPFVFPLILTIGLLLDERNNIPRGYLLLSLFFPGAMIAYNATPYLALVSKRRWKSYWTYLCLGYLLWTIILVLWAKFYLFLK